MEKLPTGDALGPIRDGRPLALAMTALQQATRDEVMLAFRDAAQGFALAPSADNAQKVALTMLAVRRHHERGRSAPAGAGRRH